MGKYAYFTYIDSKYYLKGLNYMSYSLSLVNSKFPLIVLFSDQISEQDIKDNIKYNNYILKKINNYTKDIKYNNCEDENILKPLLKQENMVYHLHINRQVRNIIGPLYAFNFEEYEALLYIHCDAILLDSIDSELEKILNRAHPKGTILAPGIYQQDGKNKIYDSHYCFIIPDKRVWESVKQVKDKPLTSKNINFDNFINELMLKNLTIGKMTLESEDNKYWHNYGPIKYWKCFTNINLETILKSKNKKDIINFITQSMNNIYRSMSEEEQAKLSPLEKELIGNYIKANSLERIWKQ